MANSSMLDELLDQFETEWVPDISLEPFVEKVSEAERSELIKELIRIDAHYRMKNNLDCSPNVYDKFGQEHVRFAAQVISQLRRNKPPATIGPYTVGERIGRGGFGDVFIGHRAEPIEQTVAIKLIRKGRGSDEVISRFEGERKALARMNHPNIVRITDAGTVNDHPYFVMEHVSPGSPISDYCDENRLSIRQRLELFSKLCNAIEHAHQKAVIHRDLKPGNILVTEIEGVPQPKVIDFGLAKALEEPLADQHVSRAGQPIGTYRYMSPEQALGKLDEIDTRTDVYSLGVVLYELLTGTTPMDDETGKLLRTADVEQFARIFKREPPRPSKRLDETVNQAVSTIAEQRKTAPTNLRLQLRNELDWIVMKALKTDAGERFNSVRDLTSDVESYLSKRPVSARPPSVFYLARKWCQRNSWLTLLGCVSLLFAIITAFGVYSYVQEQKRLNAQLLQVNQEEKESRLFSERVAKYMENAFRSSDPMHANKDVRVGEVIQNAIVELENEFPDDSETKHRLLMAFGNTFLGAYDGENALAVFERCKKIGDKLFPAGDTRQLASILGVAEARNLAKRSSPTTIALCNDSLSRIQNKQGSSELKRSFLSCLAAAHLANNEPDLALNFSKESIASLGSEIKSLNEIKLMLEHLFVLQRIDSELAIQSYELAYPMAKENFPITYLTLFKVNFGSVLANQNPDHYERAIEILKTAYETAEEKLSSQHTVTLVAKHNYALLLTNAGKPASARPLQEEVLDHYREKFGASHKSTWSALRRLLTTNEDLGDSRTNIPILEEYVELARSLRDPDDLDYLRLVSQLGSTYNKAGLPRKSIPLIKEVIASLERTKEETYAGTLVNKSNLALAYNRLGETEKAIEITEQLTPMYEQVFSPEHRNTIALKHNLAGYYSDANRHSDALKKIDEVLQIKEKLFANTNTLFLSKTTKAEILFNAGRQEIATVLLDSTISEMEAVAEIGSVNLSHAKAVKANFFKQTLRFQKAIEIYQDIAPILLDAKGPNNVETKNAFIGLADAARQTLQFDLALTTLQELREQLRHAGQNDSSIQVELSREIGLTNLLSGDLEAASKILESTLARSVDLFGETDFQTKLVLARLLSLNGGYVEANQFFSEIAEIVVDKYSHDHDTIKKIQLYRGIHMVRSGNYRSAVQVLKNRYENESELPLPATYRCGIWLGIALLGSNEEEGKNLVANNLTKIRHSEFSPLQAMQLNKDKIFLKDLVKKRFPQLESWLVELDWNQDEF